MKRLLFLPLLFLCLLCGKVWAIPPSPPVDVDGAISTHSADTSAHYGELIVVNGVLRAKVYKNSAGEALKIELFHDTAITDYGNTATEGSIAWAIDQLPAYDGNYGDGGSVYLNGGVYLVTTSIELRGQLQIDGTGIDSTVIMAGSITGNLDIFKYTGASHSENEIICEFSNLSIHGSSANHAFTTRGIVTGDATYHLIDVLLENVFIQYCSGDGIYVYDGWGVKLLNVIIEFCGGNGLYVKTSSYIKIASSKIKRNSQHGVHLAGGGNGTITNSEFGTDDDTATYNGLYIQATNITVSNSTFSVATNVPTANGIPVKISGDRCTFVNNVLEGNNQVDYGLVLTKNNVVISGNVFNGFSVDGIDNQVSNLARYSSLSSNYGYNRINLMAAIGSWNELKLTDDMQSPIITANTSVANFITLPTCGRGKKYTIIKATDQIVYVQAESYLPFTAGETEIAVGNTITGGTSSATAKIATVSISSGSWVGGDAEGILTVFKVSGAFNAAEDLNVGGSKVAETNGLLNGDNIAGEDVGEAVMDSTAGDQYKGAVTLVGMDDDTWVINHVTGTWTYGYYTP